MIVLDYGWFLTPKGAPVTTCIESTEEYGRRPVSSPLPDLRPVRLSAPPARRHRPCRVLFSENGSASWYVSRVFAKSPAATDLTLPCPFNLTCSSTATITAHPSKQQCRGCSLGPLHVKHKRCEVRPFFRYNHDLLSFVSPRAVCKFSNGIFLLLILQCVRCRRCRCTRRFPFRGQPERV